MIVPLAAVVAAAVATGGASRAAEPPSIELVLQFQPSRPHVDYDVPTEEEAAKCQVTVEQQGELSGWMVLGPNGQILRRFIDTDDDDVVDQWRYYQNGMEIYRDLDTNGNRKTDQFRFVNQGGSRWGIDANEDGKIDSWKILSAEEASQIAVQAILTRDPELLATVLINQEDIKELGIDEKIAADMLAAVASPAEQLAQVAKGSKVFAKSSKWIKLDSSMPGLVPTDTGKASEPLFVRENAVAILDLQGETGLAQIGEIVRIGNVWKLTQIPTAIEGENMQIASGGLLMQPVATPAQGGSESISEEMQKLLESLQKLDADAPAPQDGYEAFAKYNAKRADILAELVEAAESPEDKAIWTRQFADSVSSAVSTGVYPEGIEKLRAVEEDLGKSDADAELRSYVQFRRLFAEYYKRLRDADGEEQVDVQTWWNERLQEFVKAFPKSQDASEALLQLALAEEIRGKLDEAAKWYKQLASGHPESSAGIQAKGALHRLSLKGKPLELTASRLQGDGTISTSDYKGKVLLVLFWSTTCKPCDEDLPLLLSLYDQYHSQGFEILGVNVDRQKQAVAPYLEKHKVAWPQVHEEGALQSKPARQFGIITLPTMILVGKDGNVASRGISAEDLKATLPDMLQ